MTDSSKSDGNRSHGSTSSTLLERVRANDSAAWQQLIHVYGPLVYFWCRQSGLQSQDAADVFQEVFTALARHLNRFQKNRQCATFRGWLWTITKNKIRDFCRANATRPTARGGEDAVLLGELAVTIQNQETPVDDDALTHVVRRAVDLVKPEFSPSTWQAFSKSTFEEATSTQVGQELGISPNAVRKAKARVLRRLRELLDGLIEL